jgi:serine/threonine-protein kinase
LTLDSGTRLGRYEIRSKIGEGGMGEVYLAQDTKLDRKVAVKILPAEVAVDRNRMTRFVHEAKAASALNHPNIITIHEIDQSDSGHFIATEFVDGETLRERMRNAPMKVTEVLDIATQIAGALGAAHAAGIVHRDIKPENVMLRRDGIVKVLDFGLAKLIEHLPAESVDLQAPTRAAVYTEPGVVMGTALYMSPEQARGLQVDPRTDIFSLGVLIYEMIAGRLPFEGSNKNEVLASLLSDKEPTPLTRYAREVPPELERIVEKGLRKDREQRYQTIKDILLDFTTLKRRLEFAAEVERSRPPEITLGSATLDATASGKARQTMPTTGRQARRLRLLIVLAILVVIAVVVSYVVYFSKREAVINSIAVLPFVNTTADPNTEYISDGMTESIVNSLSKLPNLKIISLISVAGYKGKQIDPQAVGREMNVRAVLVGKVAQRGDGLVVSAELVDVQDKSHIWGEQYNRKLADILTVQQEISTEIAEQLRFKLSGEQQGQLTKRYTENPEAYQSYLKGRYYWNKRSDEGFKKAAGYFQEAIDRDPNYALAYAGLADTLSFGGGQTLPKARTAAMKALEIDNTLGEAHAAFGWIKLRYDFDWSGAESEFKRAIEVNPNYATTHNWYSVELGLMGRFDEAIAEAKRAQELEPLSMIINTVMGLPFYFSHQYDQAIAQFRKVIEMDPNFVWVHYWLGLAYSQKGMYQEAVTEFLQARTLSADRPENISALREALAASGWRGFVQRDAELRIEESKKHYVDSYGIAVDFAVLGEKEQALEWLEKAYDEKSQTLFWFRRDPAVDSLRSEPRFTALEKRASIPPE